MLRIGELASYVGISTRTVRFYHQLGLLPEPERNAAGYRLYGADDVLRLSRIVALASAGVPLARIQELLGASDTTFSDALEEIDADLRHRIRQLKDDRLRLQRLRAGDALTLPDVIARHLAYLRSADIDQSRVDHYRDSWVLTHALYADRFDPWLREFGEHMYGDPDYLDLMVRMFQVIDHPPDSPDLDSLANDAVQWMIDNWRANSAAWGLDFALDDPVANDLLNSQWVDTPAWSRLNELLLEGLRAHRPDHPVLNR